MLTKSFLSDTEASLIREAFPDWDNVNVWVDDLRNKLKVQLSANRERFEQYREDYATVISNLFLEKRVADLAAMISQRSRNSGLRRYGRKRR